MDDDIQNYDVVVVGGGVAAFAGGMYAGRLGLKTIIIGESMGGTIILTNLVENYPGFKKITGQELADRLREHALDYSDFVTIRENRVTRIERRDESESFLVHIGDEVLRAKAIIYSTGTQWRELKVPGHDEFRNRGVHYCALCDGFFYRGKTVAIIGGSDSAAKEALILAEHAAKVYMIYRGDKIRPEPINGERVANNKKIEIINKTNVIEIKGDESGVTGVMLDNPYQGSNELRLDGIFVAIGHTALSDIARDAGVEVNDKGEIRINRKSETNMPGFFAAGDVVDSHFKQAIIGVSEAVMASYSAYEYISSRKIVWSKITKPKLQPI